MTKIIDALLARDAGQVVFRSVSHGDITYGQIRSMASLLAKQQKATSDKTYVYTRSASVFCAAFIAAVLAGNDLIVLPQAGSDYLAQIGATGDQLMSDAVDGALMFDWADLSNDAEFAPSNENDPLLTFFTSGSSGAPKQIVKPISVVEAEAKVWVDWFANDIDHIAGSVSHQHIYGLIFRLALPVLGNITAQDDMALSWEALMDVVSPKTLIVSSPAHLSRLPEKGAISHTQPAYILSSGGPLKADDSFATAKLLGVQPLEILGSTETGGVAWRQRDVENEPWTPVAGVKLSLGIQGELMVTSPFIPDAEPVKMGDRVEIGEDGRFVLLGRIDRIVKVEGKRVSLPRVEEALSSHPMVGDCAVIMTSQNGRDRLSALVCLTQEGQLELGKLGSFKMSRYLRKLLSDNLEPAEWPKRMRFVSHIPTNSQSKRVVAEMQSVFESVRLLEVLAPSYLQVEGFDAEIRFTAKPHLPWFEGHFKENPILPGVAQTHIAARLAEEIWAASPASFNVNRMKFQQVIQPHDDIILTLGFKPETEKLNFAFKRGEDKLSSGTIG